ncbi:ribonuclease HI [Helicobacter sp. 23-1044]
MKKVIIFCDGACLENPGAGGWCAILDYNGAQKTISGGKANTTNNQMELRAVIEGLKALKEPCEVEIVSDSKYVCDGINLWLKKWIAKDFKEVKNPDLWREYISYSRIHAVKTTWVKGHSGHPQNEECDKIAKIEAEKFKGIHIKDTL